VNEGAVDVTGAYGRGCSKMCEVAVKGSQGSNCCLKKKKQRFHFSTILALSSEKRGRQDSD